jgi:hypothetical protein
MRDGAVAGRPRRQATLRQIKVDPVAFSCLNFQDQPVLLVDLDFYCIVALIVFHMTILPGR